MQTIKDITKRFTSSSQMIEAAMGPIKGVAIGMRNNGMRRVGGANLAPEYEQSSVRHIDHYIDGIDAKRRERKPFDPVKYMKTGMG